MNQTEQLIDQIAVILLDAGWRDTSDAQWSGLLEALPKLQKALGAEPVKLVRLTDEEIEAVCDAYGITKVMLAKGFANAIMDTLEAKNGGKT